MVVVVTWSWVFLKRMLPLDAGARTVEMEKRVFVRGKKGNLCAALPGARLALNHPSEETDRN